jgi:hypothetical protein
LENSAGWKSFHPAFDSSVGWCVARLISDPPAGQPTQTPSPTPLYPLDLSGYDPDLYGPVDVLHNPPLIAKVDDTVRLVFDFGNIFAMRFPINPILEGVLYFAYGDSDNFLGVTVYSLALYSLRSMIDQVRVWIAQ